MIRGDDFRAFLKQSLDELVEEQSKVGYEEMSVDSDSEVCYDDIYEDDDEANDFEESEDSSDDYFNDSYSEAEEYSSKPENIESTPFRKYSHSDEVVNDFTSRVFEELVKKYSPSAEVKERVYNTKQAFEGIPDELDTIDFCGNTFKFKKYEQPLEFDDSVILKTEDTYDATLKNFQEILYKVMTEIEKIYGGFSRITDIAIVSDVLIINGVAFEPLLKYNLIQSLPVDLQYSVSYGCFAHLFDFYYLPQLKNLVNFKVDSADFMYSKVRIDLGKGKNFEPKDLFSICKKLDTVQIGSIVITRRDMNSANDVFGRVRRSTEIADKLEKLGFAGTKASWGCVRDIYKGEDRSNIWKAVKLVGMTGLASTATVGALGFKLGRMAVGVGAKAVKGVGSIIDAVKENS